MLALFESVVGFDWDDGNLQKNERHAVHFREAEEVFLCAKPLVAQDHEHSSVEPRFHALGITSAGRLLHVTFTLRSAGALIRVISARDMSRKERVIYGQAAQEDAQVRH